MKKTPDREFWIVGKRECAQFFGVSLTTVDKWVVKGCPVAVQGGRGKPYLFDLRAVAEFYYMRETINAPRAKAEAAAGNTDPDTMSPEKRLKWIQAERQFDELRESRGELMKREDHRSVLREVFKRFSTFLDTFADVLERSANLSPQQTNQVVKAVDKQRAVLYADLTEGDGREAA